MAVCVLVSVLYHSAMTKKSAKTTADLYELTEHIVKHMATKDEVAELRAEMNGRFNGVQNQLEEMLDSRLEMRARIEKLEAAVFGTDQR